MSKTIKLIAAGAVVISAAVVFARTTALTFFYDPEPAAQASIPVPQIPVASSSVPIRFIIPSLHINAAVQEVGLNAMGNMMAPDNFTDVAWYKYGPTPGTKGSAVIDGHVDNGLGLAGVFKNLNKLQTGSDIFVIPKKGPELHFVVTDIKVYPYDAVPTDLLFNQNDAARLNVITCEGGWVSGGDTYDHRLVVFSKLVQ